MSILAGVASGAVTRSYTMNLRSADSASSAPGEDAAGTDAPSVASDTVELSSAARLRLERIEAEKAAADTLVKALKSRSSSESKFHYNSNPEQKSLELYKQLNPNYTSRELTVDDAIEYQNQVAANFESSNPVKAARFRVGADFDPEAMLNEIARQGDFDTALFRKEADEGPEAFLTAFATNPVSKEEAAAVDGAGSLARHYSELKRFGQNEQAATFRDTIENGGLRFQSVDKVADLNASYQKLSARAESGGTNSKYYLELNPTGDAKNALESGDALIVKLGSLGAYYVTY